MDEVFDDNISDKAQNERPNRTERVNLRTTADEKSALHRRAQEAGTSLTDYVLSICLKDTITFKTPLRDKEGIIAELRRIGNNINQIARHLNQNKQDPLSNPVLLNLEKCRAQLLEIGNKILKD